MIARIGALSESIRTENLSTPLASAAMDSAPIRKLRIPPALIGVGDGERDLGEGRIVSSRTIDCVYAFTL
jgi:hypothetical protein